MRVRASAATFLFVIAVCAGAAEGENASTPEPREALVLPKVATRDTIIKPGQPVDPTKLNEWAARIIEGKVKRANVELEGLKKKTLAEEDVRVASERERQRRQEKYNQNWGNIGPSGGSVTKRGGVRMRLDFQVPEIETLRAIVDTLNLQQYLATDVAQTLSMLDKDGDGKLAGEEYRDAGAITATCGRLLVKLDANGDDFINEEEIVLGRRIPASASNAVRSGRDVASVAGYRIKIFDADTNGVLDVNERKAMGMAFVDLSIRFGQDAAFYKLAQESLAHAREPVAAKFADIEIAP